MAGLFVTPEWVEDRCDDVVLVEVRDEWAYRDVPVPGVVSIPFGAFRDPTEETEGYLPTADGVALLSERRTLWNHVPHRREIRVTRSETGRAPWQCPRRSAVAPAVRSRRPT